MPAKGKQIIDLEVELTHQTDGAWLVKSTDTGKQAWVPKVVAEFGLNPGETRIGIITMPTGMAQEKDLI